MFFARTLSPALKAARVLVSRSVGPPRCRTFSTSPGDKTRLPGCGGLQRVTDNNFVVGNEIALLQHRLQRREPDLVVAHRQIVRRVAVLARKARHVDVPLARHGHGERQRKGPLFPFGMEYRLVRFGLHRAEAVRAAHVLRAVHLAHHGMKKIAALIKNPTFQSSERMVARLPR